MKAGPMSDEQSSNYFDAAMHAYQVLGVAAPKYLARLQQLAQYNSSEELTPSLMDGARKTLSLHAQHPRHPPQTYGRLGHSGGVLFVSLVTAGIGNSSVNAAKTLNSLRMIRPQSICGSVLPASSRTSSARPRKKSSHGWTRPLRLFLNGIGHTTN